MAQSDALKSGGLQAEAREILDSRGRGTVEVKLSLGEYQGIGDVPAGASKGEDEARTVSVAEAIDNINKVLLPLLQDADADLADRPGQCLTRCR